MIHKKRGGGGVGECFLNGTQQTNMQVFISMNVFLLATNEWLQCYNNNYEILIKLELQVNTRARRIIQKNKKMAFRPGHYK